MTRTLSRRYGALLTAALAILFASALLAQTPPSPQTPMKGDRRAWVWHFGTAVGLSFASGSPVPLERGPMIAAEGCASVCDARTGALLFFTDGYGVWDGSGQNMPNGYGLGGHSSSTQSALIVPKPDDDST